MRNKVILTVALMLVAGVGFAVARPVGQRLRAPRGPGHRIVAALDTDRDGQISAEELEAAATSLLTLDANGDGVLTPDEQGAPGARRGP